MSGRPEGNQQDSMRSLQGGPEENRANEQHQQQQQQQHQQQQQTASAPSANAKHARNVSWDLALKQPSQQQQQEGEDGVSAVTSPPAIVSLKDLTGIAPMESEAETLLVSALEENQEKQSGGGAPGGTAGAAAGGGPGVETNALNNLTPEEDSIFTNGIGGGGGGDDDGGDAQSAASSRRPLPEMSNNKQSLFHKDASQDTTKHLWTLASHMKKKQQQSSSKYSQENLMASSGSGRASSGGGGGQGDWLAMHATHLSSRRNAKGKNGATASDGTASDNGSEVDDPAGGNSNSNNNGNGTAKKAHKWNKLRAAVQFHTGAAAADNAADAKKTDGDIEQGGSNNNMSSENHQPNGSPEDDAEEEDSNDGSPQQQKQQQKTKKEMNHESTLHAEFEAFRQWVAFKKTTLIGYIRKALMFAILPATGIAALLFYIGENPPCGTQAECLMAQQDVETQQQQQETMTDDATTTNSTIGEGAGIDEIFGNIGRARYDSPSISWWILFIGVRQVITLSMARMMEALIIDFWVLRSRTASAVLGPYLSLLIVQAKGWPIRLIIWGLLDIGMLYGDRPFARHWLFWQDEVDLFNDANPAGRATEGPMYRVLLSLMCVIGGLVALKRFMVGLSLGRKTYQRYGSDLAKIMKKIILVSEVAELASDIKKYQLHTEDFGLHSEIYKEDTEAGGNVNNSSSRLTAQSGKLAANLTTFAGMDSAHRIRVAELLGEWEEPELAQDDNQDVDIASVIQFRKSLSYLDTHFPFSVTFGPASTRESCVRSAETVYKQLKTATPKTQHVVFDTLALSGIQQDGTLDDHKLRELIKIFRPDRNGDLPLLEFCKSIDTVYKELRLFRASVANAARVDRSVEKIINIVFYFIVLCISLAVLGIDPFALFAAISGFILGFAFMIGAACSKYFEGLLMILIRKPYDIGDKIQVASPTDDSSSTGSSYWIVKDVGLYHTTYMFWTQETATCSNGALANTRIINASRSPQALLITTFKFPIDTPHNKIEIFKSTMEKFVKNRPREWLCFFAFRPTRVEADGGFVEYVFVAQHRENWANIGALKDSLADVSYFALEMAKKMDMRYTAPPMPVNLNMMTNGNNTSSELQQQMAAQVMNQSDRLQQPLLGNNNNNNNNNNVSPRGHNGPSSPAQQYDFSEIEAMLNKDK